MKRRDFVKLASMAGLGVVAGAAPFNNQARAEGPYTGPLWIMVHASGGWDPTSLCDPKGTEDPEDPNRVNNYLVSEIEQAGNLRYAPVANNAAFFQKHYDKLLVINGIDCATNSHDAGTRAIWSGTLTENRPGFAALVAGIYGPTLPMSYLTYGGYETTADVVAITRAGNTSVIERVAFPERINPTDENDLSTYHSAETTKRIQEARNARHLAMAEQQHLPSIQQSMSMLYLARSGQNELQKLSALLPDTLESATLKRQAQVVMAAYRAGVCVSANLSIGGFDTHGNHDQNHFPALQELMEGVAFILEEAEKYPETAGNVVVVVGSDFGRTPYYNTGDGKDHWSITSMMLAGKGIAGNRVIGATDPYHSPLGVDPSTLAVQDTGGTRITPAHVHASLRKLAGIEDNEVTAKFPLTNAETMPLFGG